jgi:hypothetical protein
MLADDVNRGCFVRSGDLLQLATAVSTGDGKGKRTAGSGTSAGATSVSNKDWVLTLASTDLLGSARGAVNSGNSSGGVRREVRLVYRESLLGAAAATTTAGAGVGVANGSGSGGGDASDQMMNQLWQVESFGTQPLPTWTARPFLSGNYLTAPTSVR